MDYIKTLNLLINNPANNFSTTSLDLIDTMIVAIELEEKKQLILSGVGCSLPTKEEVKNQIGKRLFEDNNIKYETTLIKPKESGYYTGFLECYEFMTNKG